MPPNMEELLQKLAVLVLLSALRLVLLQMVGSLHWLKKVLTSIPTNLMILYVCVRSVEDLILPLIVGRFAQENAETRFAQFVVSKLTVTNVVVSGVQDL